MTAKRLVIACALALLGAAGPAAAGVKYWDHGGTDDRWSNPTNWNNNTAIASNDNPTVRNTECPDSPQTILLDMDAFITFFSITATGNRHVTINTDNGSALIFSNGNGIYGARGVDVTIHSAIKMSSTGMTIDRSDRAVTLNGNIGPAPGSGVPYLSPKSGGVLTLAGSNNVSYFLNNGAGEVVVKNPHALGNGYFKANDDGCTLSIATNARLYGDLLAPTAANSSLNLRIADAGTNDVTLIVDGDCNVGERIAILTNATGSTGRFLVRLRSPGSYTLRWDTQTNTTLSFEGGAAWGDATGKGVVSGGCAVVIDGGGTTTKLYAACAYTGGTTIRSGTLLLQDHNRLPTNGSLTIESAGYLSLYAKSQAIATLAGNGTVLFSTTSAFGTNSVTGLFSPGPGAGTMTFTNPGRLILGPDSVSRFELGALAGASDKAVFGTSISHVTLGGTLSVVNLGGLEPGSYTLFDMAGGAIAGSFARIDMPRGFMGSIQTAGGDVVLAVTRIKGPGAVMLVK